MPGTTDGTYIDLYLLPVPRKHLDAYREKASLFGDVTIACGALSYREFVHDAAGEGFDVDAGNVLTTAIVEFTSKAHRDDVMEAVMADPRVAGMVEAEQLADMRQMQYGGFAPLVVAPAPAGPLPAG